MMISANPKGERERERLYVKRFASVSSRKLSFPFQITTLIPGIRSLFPFRSTIELHSNQDGYIRLHKGSQ
ncbi:hypothetical protein L6452_36086 [Arctium lappa]|uniref:Uncharacterized protein n=1 Tax=Arctium lappa TaxID=4217 RepID=A0ACB8Y8A2_ARCLA|nr:hypothetical protein L6452_36086 [Arctium lappa]